MSEAHSYTEKRKGDTMEFYSSLFDLLHSRGGGTEGREPKEGKGANEEEGREGGPMRRRGGRGRKGGRGNQ